MKRLILCHDESYYVTLYACYDNNNDSDDNTTTASTTMTMTTTITTVMDFIIVYSLAHTSFLTFPSLALFLFLTLLLHLIWLFSFHLCTSNVSTESPRNRERDNDDDNDIDDVVDDMAPVCKSNDRQMLFSTRSRATYGSNYYRYRICSFNLFNKSQSRSADTIGSQLHEQSDSVLLLAGVSYIKSYGVNNDRVIRKSK